MPRAVRKRKPPKPLPHPPDLPDVASVFEVELSRLGATRAKGTLADRLRALDWLESEPVQIVKGLLLAQHFGTFAEAWRESEESVAKAAEEALRALNTLDRALAESGAKRIIVGSSDVPGGDARELLDQARRVVECLGVPSKSKGRPPKSRDLGSAGPVAVALEVLARAGLAGLYRRIVLDAKDPVTAWAKESALALCGPDPNFRKRRFDTLFALKQHFSATVELPKPLASYTDATLMREACNRDKQPPDVRSFLETFGTLPPLPPQFDLVLHPVLYPAIRETIKTR